MSDIISGSSTRIKTGIALLAAFLLMGYIDSLLLTWFMFGVLMFIGLSESMNLFKIEDDKIYIYALAIWVGAYFYPKPEDLVFLVGIIFASILAYTKEFNKQLFLPLMYPIVSFLFLLSLYVSFGIESLLWLVAVVAGADVGAYFIGKSIGATKFCETSPNKTLEGVFGGIFTAAVLGIVFSPESMGFFSAFIISLFVAAASVFGDLFESYLKREADVKDSGDILPGHGGILDRSDGFLFGGIVMLILLRFVA
ncbi:MAG: phosphatidate cytidylyltransferase [Campylobacterota bacterium]|nr:phosphatidate cytidylyltransferase [Campylobacterota bacterium]